MFDLNQVIIDNWRLFAQDNLCYHTASAIVDIENTSKVFAVIADNLINGQLAILPAFVKADLESASVGVLYNVLTYASKVSTTTSDVETLKRKAKDKFIRTNQRLGNDAFHVVCELIEEVGERKIQSIAKNDFFPKLIFKERNKAYKMLEHPFWKLVFDGQADDWRDTAFLCMTSPDGDYNTEELTFTTKTKYNYDRLFQEDRFHYQKYQRYDLKIGTGLFSDPYTYDVNKVKTDIASEKKEPTTWKMWYSEIVRDNVSSMRTRAKTATRFIRLFSLVLDHYCEIHLQSCDNDVLKPYVKLRRAAYKFQTWKIHARFEELKRMRCGSPTPLLPRKGRYEGKSNLNTFIKRYEFMCGSKRNIFQPGNFDPINWKYVTVKLDTVPKSVTSRRTITPISEGLFHEVYHVDKALRQALDETFPEHFCFRDQSIQWNRLAAGWGTADASSASDLISVFQVVAAFPCGMWKEFVLLRPCIVEVDSCVFCLFMYGGMGHSLTFPIETYLFILGVFSNVPEGVGITGYGDDITVEKFREVVECVTRAYAEFGWKLNLDKSFLSPEITNGESCGAFRFGSEIRTLLRISRKIHLNDDNTVDAELLLAMIAWQRTLYLNGHKGAAEHLASILKKFGITGGNHTAYEWLSDDPEYAITNDVEGVNIWATSIDITCPKANSRKEIIDTVAYYINQYYPADTKVDYVKYPEEDVTYFLTKGREELEYDWQEKAHVVSTKEVSRTFYVDDIEFTVPEIRSSINRDRLVSPTKVELVNKIVERCFIPVEGNVMCEINYNSLLS